MIEYVFIFSSILILGFFEELLNKFKVNIIRFFLFAFILFFICGSISRGDYYSYLYFYDDIDLNEPKVSFEVGFFWLSYFIKLFSDDYYHFLFFISSVSFVIKFYFLWMLNKLTSLKINYCFYFLIYLSFFLIYLDIGSIRFSLACSFLLVSFIFLIGGKYFYSVGMIFLASSFHASAIVTVLFIYVYKKNIDFYFLIFSFFLGLLLITLSSSSLVYDLFSANYYFSKIINYSRFGSAILTLQLVKKIILMGVFYFLFKRDIYNQGDELVKLCWRVYLFGFSLWCLFMLSQVAVSRYLLMFSILEPIMFILILRKFDLRSRIIVLWLMICFLFSNYIYVIQSNSNEVNLYLPYKNFILGDLQPYRDPEIHQLILSK